MSAAPASLRLLPFRRVVTDAPVSYSVYSAFSFYGSRRGGELPGTWLSAGLGALGHELAAIRQTLYRMERSEELRSRPSGRVKFYRLSPYAQAEAEAGLAKIMNTSSESWDGEWTLVQLRQRDGDGDGADVVRERVREILRAEGFAAAGPGLFVHPRDRIERLRKATSEHDAADMVEIFRGRRLGATTDRAFVAEHWDLDALAKRYEKFLTKYEPVERLARTLSNEQAFVLRFAVVFDHLETGWKDPDLVEMLLPRDWPGLAARRLARRLYGTLLPGALAFADSLM